MLDDLRRLDDNELPFDDDEDEVVVEGEGGEERRFLGMTAVERMFLSIFLFLNVTVIGIALLLVTRRIVF